jgi:hypothetical protein
VTSPAVLLRANAWTPILYEIEGTLTHLVLGPDGYVVFNVARHDDPFLQFLSMGGAVTGEASATVRSSTNTQSRELVDPESAARLVALGWHPQSPTH